MWRAKSIGADIRAYFECEASGNQHENQCSMESFNPLFSIFIMISYVLQSNTPIILVVFFIEPKKLRKCIPRYCMKMNTQLI